MKRQIDTSIFIWRQGAVPGHTGIASAPEATAAENVGGARAKEESSNVTMNQSRARDRDRIHALAFYRRETQPREDSRRGADERRIARVAVLAIFILIVFLAVFLIAFLIVDVVVVVVVVVGVIADKQNIVV